MDFLLLENGDRLLLEDGGGFLLEFSPVHTGDPSLLLESGDHLLLEDGSYLLLEGVATPPVTPPTADPPRFIGADSAFAFGPRRPRFQIQAADEEEEELIAILALLAARHRGRN